MKSSTRSSSGYVEQEQSAADIISAGFDPAVVHKITRLIDISEYKRKQMPPGLKVTSRAFGFGRRMPIAQGYDAKWGSSARRSVARKNADANVPQNSIWQTKQVEGFRSFC